MSTEVEVVPAGAGRTIIVRNNSELFSAINTLTETGGGTIQLAAEGGPYRYNGYRKGGADAPITITSADPDSPAVMHTLTLNKCDNFTFENITFDSSSQTGLRDSHVDDVNVLDCDGIAFRDCTFINTADRYKTRSDPEATGGDLGVIRDSTDVVFENNTVSQYFQGLTVLDSTGVLIRGNDISKMQGDGLRLSGVVDTVIEDNKITDFHGSTNDINHDDLIQIWQTGAKQVTQNVIIRNNYLDAGGHAASQSIFIRNEGGEPFHDILIEGNVIRNGKKHGIAVLDVEDVTITNNTVLWSPYAEVRATETQEEGTSAAPWIRARGDNITITHNIATNVSLEGTGTVENNALLNYKNPSAPEYYANHFVNLMGKVEVAPSDLWLKEDSPWANEVGAPASWALANGELGDFGEGLQPVIQTTSLDSSAYTIFFDARASLYNGATVAPEDLEVTWLFADGSSASGSHILRKFNAPGLEQVTAIVTHASGDSVTYEAEVSVQHNTLVDLDLAGAPVDLSDFDSVLGYSPTDLSTEGFELTGDSRLVVSRENGQIHNLSSFDLSITLSLEMPYESGVFLDFPRVIRGSVDDDGAVSFRVVLDGQVWWLDSGVAVFNDAGAHELNVTYNAQEALLSLSIDGTVLDAETANGTTADATYFGLTLGNTWDESVAGTVHDFSLRTSREPDLEAGLAPDPQAGLQADLDDLTALVAFDFEAPIVMDISDFEARLRGVGLQSAWSADGATGQGLDLGSGSVVTVDRANAQLFELDSFTFATSLQRDALEEGGKFLHFHKAMHALVTDEGALRFVLRTDEGVFTLESEAGLVADQAWHRILVSYSDASDQLELFVDGTSVAQSTASGTTLPASHFGMALGNLWGDNLDAVLDDVVLAREAVDGDHAHADYALFKETLTGPTADLTLEDSLVFL